MEKFIAIPNQVLESKSVNRVPRYLKFPIATPINLWFSGNVKNSKTIYKQDPNIETQVYLVQHYTFNDLSLFCIITLHQNPVAFSIFNLLYL
jgi:hypothetical protein